MTNNYQSLLSYINGKRWTSRGANIKKILNHFLIIQETGSTLFKMSLFAQLMNISILIWLFQNIKCDTLNIFLKRLNVSLLQNEKIFFWRRKQMRTRKNLGFKQKRGRAYLKFEKKWITISGFKDKYKFVEP